MMEMSKKVRVTEAAEILDVHRKTVLRYIQTGMLRAFRAGEGCMWLIDREDLANVLRPNIPIKK